MICEKCGTENNANAKFCRGCGGALENEKPKFKFDFKKYKKLIIGACAILAIVAVIVAVVSIISAVAGSDKYIVCEDYISCMYSPESEKTVIIYNGTTLPQTIDATASISSTSDDGSVAAIITSDDELYVVQKEKVNKIADDVEYVELSRDGKVAVYVDEDDTLYKVQLKNKKITKIADDAEFNGYMSADGNIICYLDEDEISHARIGSKDTEMDEDFTALFPLKKGKMFIGTDEDNDLVIYNVKKGEMEKICNEPESVITNLDYTELLITVNSKAYISINGGERQKIGNYRFIYPLLPDDAVNGSSILNITTAVKSFAEMLMIYQNDDGEYGIGYLDKKYEMHEIVDGIDFGEYYSYYDGTIYVTDDFSSVYYIRNGSLYVANKKSDFEPEKLTSKVSGFEVAPNGKKVYYINNDDELICLNNAGKKSAEKITIAEYVHSFVMTSKGNVFFIADYSSGSGTLYRCKDGKNKVRVADDVASVYAYSKYVKYYTESDPDNYNAFDIYMSTNDKSFKKIAEEVSYQYLFYNF